MRLQKEFETTCALERAAEVLAEDATLEGLFPDAKTEIVERDANLRTVRSHYTALGREGVATFHFVFESNGEVHFEKVCDGRVWSELTGVVTLANRRNRVRVSIELEGRTKSLVPEFTIRGPMQDQLSQMAEALEARLSDAA